MRVRLMVSIREGPESSVMIVLDELLNCLVNYCLITSAKIC